MLTRMRVGIVGASGYTGAELLRLAAGHPELEVVLVTGDTQAGTPVADLYPSLLAAYGDLTFAPYTAEAVDGLDLVFCGLPHGTSQEVVPEVRDRVKWVLDLSADFRLKDPALYPQWYGAEHSAPELLSEFAYGLPELFRDETAGAAGGAGPGGSPTGASRGLGGLSPGRGRRRVGLGRAWVLPDRGLAGAGAARAGGRGRDRRDRGRRRQRGVRRGAGPQAHHPVLCRRRALRRLRAARPPPHPRGGE